MDKEKNNAAYDAGRILGFLIFGGAIILLYPWAALSAIDGLFNVPIQHTPVNYFWFWVLSLTVGGFRKGF